MQKKPFQKDLISERHPPQKWDAHKRKKTDPNLSNSDLIKFLTDDNINKHYFLVIINMHHWRRQLSKALSWFISQQDIVDEYKEWFYPSGEIGLKPLCITKMFGLSHVSHTQHGVIQ